MTIAGITVPLADLKIRHEVIGGEQVRAGSGALRSDARARKRGYAATTAYLSRTEAAALMDAVALDTIVLVDASAYEAGATFSAMVRATEADVLTGAADDGAAVLQILTLTIREV